MKTWQEVYKLPFKDNYIDKEDNWRSGRVHDAKDQFVFQFLNASNETQAKVLDIINGIDHKIDEHIEFVHIEGDIIDITNRRKLLKIRGWGNLTGTGGHNLSGEDAANVQDGFADYIVERLNNMVNQ